MSCPDGPPGEPGPPGLTEELQSALLRWSKEMLSYWMQLAKIRDEDGLPVDLMFYVVRERGKLPRVFDKGQEREVTEEEFIEGIADCVAIRQGRAPKGSSFTTEQVQAIRQEYL